MSDDVSRRMASRPAVAAFDAEMKAVEAGELFTPDQWSFARRNPEPGLPEPGITQRIPIETLDQLLNACRKPMAHTCSARRK